MFNILFVKNNILLQCWLQFVDEMGFRAILNLWHDV